jgi:septin family protein
MTSRTAAKAKPPALAAKIEINPGFRRALDIMEGTSRHVFITGKAGTGKTTFLHALRDKSPKRMIVVAPTGVAAINAGGVTLHSFFQLPFGPQIPVEAKGSTGQNSDFINRFNIQKNHDQPVHPERDSCRKGHMI